MCSPAPVVVRFGRDVAVRFGIPIAYNAPGPGGTFLGSVGGTAHATRRSSHNCYPMQESSVNGVSYHPNYAHAWDARPASKRVGEEMATAALADPRVRYVIFDNKGRKPNGEHWTTSHPTWHVSFLPGTHNDTRPFFQGADDVTPEDIRKINQGQAMIVGAAAAKIISQNQRQTNVLRTAIWQAAGKTADEIRKLEGQDPNDDEIDAAALADELADTLAARLAD